MPELLQGLEGQGQQPEFEEQQVDVRVQKSFAGERGTTAPLPTPASVSPPDVKNRSHCKNAENSTKNRGSDGLF
jgi:hypothetical protein